jgi:hypothetical protein
MIPFAGFAPDLPPEAPGIFLDCKNIIPSASSFIAAPSAVDCGLGAIDSAARGLSVTRNLDNTSLVFCGSSAKLYQQSSGVWDDVSKVGGYTLGPENRWRFTQFGNVTLAAAKSETIQFIDDGGTAFADASVTAPKADLIETINNQVFVANINGMGFGDDVTRWACSAIGDYADWTPDVDTGCVSGQLLDSPGPITGLKRLGNEIVMYKNKAIYIGQYVGGGQVWNIQRVPGEIGAASNEGVVNTGAAHFFVGPDDFYVFDGSRPTPMNSPCRQWFFTTADSLYFYRMMGAFDRVNQRVYWWFASIGSNGVIDKCIVYNLKSNQWGRADSTVECVAEYISSGVTYDQLGSLFSTYDDLTTTISYDSPFWSSGSSVVAVFQTDHKCYQLSGVAGESRITTGHYGDNMSFSTLSRIKPRFIRQPTSSTVNYSYSNEDATTFTPGSTSTFTNQWYDLLWSARWHKMEFVFNGTMAISGFDLILSQDGTE